MDEVALGEEDDDKDVSVEVPVSVVLDSSVDVEMVEVLSASVDSSVVGEHVVEVVVVR